MTIRIRIENADVGSTHVALVECGVNAPRILRPGEACDAYVYGDNAVKVTEFLKKCEHTGCDRDAVAIRGTQSGNMYVCESH